MRRIITPRDAPYAGDSTSAAVSGFIVGPEGGGGGGESGGTRTESVSTSHEITPPPDITSLKRAGLRTLDLSIIDTYSESTAPICVRHIFSIKATPEETLTHWGCDPSSSANGELFPFPAELMTGTDSLVVQPTPKPEDEGTSHPVAVGTIVGAIIFIILALVAFILFARRNRNNNHGMDDSIDPWEPMPEAHKERMSLRPQNRLRLGTIHEQPSPVSAGASPGLLSRTNKALRPSYGPNWPLGSGDPLDAHPVDLEKRLSEPAIPFSPRGNVAYMMMASSSVPQLSMPTIPSASRGVAEYTTHLSPAPAAGPRSPGLSIKSPQSSSTPTSATAMLQSPRLSYAPVSSIDAAFEDEAERRVLAIDGAGMSPTYNNNHNQSQNHSRKSSHSPVSPIESIDNRINFLSMPSMPDDDDDGDGDEELVSPISLNTSMQSQQWGGDRRGGGNRKGSVSPTFPVSPIESRRGSLASP